MRYYIQFLLQYWSSRLSRIDDFHLTWNDSCDFLLVGLAPFSHNTSVTNDRRRPCDGRLQRSCSASKTFRC